MWRLILALVAGCGPTHEAVPSFNGKGVVAQTFPFSIDSGQFGRELSGTTEKNEIHSLVTSEARPRGWYYRYLPTNDITTTEQFVPMFYDSSYLTAPNIAAATTAGQGGAIMGFNEPDLASQANMTVAQALTAWPQLEATGCRLVAPATASAGYTGGSWLDLFVTGNGGSYIPRCDVIPVHHYTSTFTDTGGTALITWLANYRATYKKPLWLTEFGMIGFPTLDPATWTYPTALQATTFLTNVIPVLRLLGYVERFSWYPNCASAAAIAANPGIANVALANPDGSLTALGTLYASL